MTAAGFYRGLRRFALYLAAFLAFVFIVGILHGPPVYR